MIKNMEQTIQLRKQPLNTRHDFEETHCDYQIFNIIACLLIMPPTLITGYILPFNLAKLPCQNL
jgi:hypothetical protein